MRWDGGPASAHLDVTATIEEQILRTEVSEDDAQLVQVRQREHDASAVEPRLVRGEGFVLLEELVELAARRELHQHVQRVRVLRHMGNA